MSAAVVPVVVTRYRCSFCQKGWAKKAKAEAHVKALCVADPDSRACPTCTNYVPAYYAPYDEGGSSSSFCDLPDGPYIGIDYQRQCTLWESADKEPQ
jgi:hypothetical protein